MPLKLPLIPPYRGKPSTRPQPRPPSPPPTLETNSAPSILFTSLDWAESELPQQHDIRDAPGPEVMVISSDSEAGSSPVRVLGETRGHTPAQRHHTPEQPVRQRRTPPYARTPRDQIRQAPAPIVPHRRRRQEDPDDPDASYRPNCSRSDRREPEEDEFVIYDSDDPHRQERTRARRNREELDSSTRPYYKTHAPSGMELSNETIGPRQQLTPAEQRLYDGEARNLQRLQPRAREHQARINRHQHEDQPRPPPARLAPINNSRTHYRIHFGPSTDTSTRTREEQRERNRRRRRSPLSPDPDFLVIPTFKPKITAEDDGVEVDDRGRPERRDSDRNERSRSRSIGNYELRPTTPPPSSTTHPYPHASFFSIRRTQNSYSISLPMAGIEQTPVISLDREAGVVIVREILEDLSVGREIGRAMVPVEDFEGGTFDVLARRGRDGMVWVVWEFRPRH